MSEHIFFFSSTTYVSSQIQLSLSFARNQK